MREKSERNRDRPIDKTERERDKNENRNNDKCRKKRRRLSGDKRRYEVDEGGRSYRYINIDILTYIKLYIKLYKLYILSYRYINK